MGCSAAAAAPPAPSVVDAGIGAGGVASEAEAASCSSLLRRQPFLAEGIRQCLHAPQRFGFGFLPDPGRILAAASPPDRPGDSANAAPWKGSSELQSQHKPQQPLGTLCVSNLDRLL